MADKAEFLSGAQFWFDCSALDGQRRISEISGLSIEVKGEAGLTPVAVGPKSQAVRQGKPVGAAKFANIKVKVVMTGNDDLYSWFKKVNPFDQGEKSEWKQTGKGQVAYVIVYGADSNPALRYEIKDCYPCKYEGPSFKAGEGELAYESFELIHNGILLLKA